MMPDDTGMNIRETVGTLLAQQQQLIDGLRPAQMFPVGTPELPVPYGFDRVETGRGVFHFNPRMISMGGVVRLSKSHRENVILGLGPYSKIEVLELMNSGEAPLVVTERTPDGVEVKAALGTQSTLPSQVSALEQQKTPGNIIATEYLRWVLDHRVRNAG